MTADSVAATAKSRVIAAKSVEDTHNSREQAHDLVKDSCRLTPRRFTSFAQIIQELGIRARTGESFSADRYSYWIGSVPLE